MGARRTEDAFEADVAGAGPTTPVATPLAPLCVDAAGLGVLLGISERHVQRLDSSGKVPEAIAFGACKRWPIDEVRAWLQAGAPPRARWATIQKEAR